jgi:hypothetical protein
VAVAVAVAVAASINNLYTIASTRRQVPGSYLMLYKGSLSCTWLYSSQERRRNHRIMYDFVQILEEEENPIG